MRTRSQRKKGRGGGEHFVAWQNSPAFPGDLQSLDAGDNGVEGGLHVGGGAGGHDGLSLLVEQLGNVLHK